MTSADIFSPKWHQLIFFFPPWGGRYFPLYRPLHLCLLPPAPVVWFPNYFVRISVFKEFRVRSYIFKNIFEICKKKSINFCKKSEMSYWHTNICMIFCLNPVSASLLRTDVLLTLPVIVNKPTSLCQPFSAWPRWSTATTVLCFISALLTV